MASRAARSGSVARSGEDADRVDFLRGFFETGIGARPFLCSLPVEIDPFAKVDIIATIGGDVRVDQRGQAAIVFG